MNIAMGSDHGGYHLKEKIKQYLETKGFTLIDFGTDSTASCDYPDYAIQVAEHVRDHTGDRGILICGSGIGVSIAANKVRGIRAALCTSPQLAELSRQHNDANILCLGERVLDVDLALQVVDAWLATTFEGGRHERRVGKIAEYENQE